jgi:cytochrome P450
MLKTEQTDTKSSDGRVPPGPEEKYSATDDLLSWMGRQFDAFGDIYQASIYGDRVYAIRDADFANHVLVENWENYVKGQNIKRVALLLGNGLMVSKGDFWKRQRRMIQPAFNHESINPLIKMIADVNARLLKKWQLGAQRNESINVTRDVSGMALEVVLRFVLGEDYERVGFHFDLLSQEQARDMTFATSFRALGKIIVELMELRRQSGAQSHDALSMLMQARDPQTGEPMSGRQLTDELLTLIVAGHETTASTLNWAWYLISQHPDVEQRLFDEANTLANLSEIADLSKLVYSRQVIDEVMRLYPAGWLLTRKALHDDRLGEYFVPSGTEVYIPLYFIQRHPDLWEEPDRFNPDRFQPEKSRNRHRLATIPFSAGPRNCIGALFARVEMQIHLVTIARYLRLRYLQTRPIELDADVNLRSKYDFIMNPESRTIASEGVA